MGTVWGAVAGSRGQRRPATGKRGGAEFWPL